jgi:hypothetical protein
MRWLNPFQANHRARLEDRARYCHRYGIALRQLARREDRADPDSPLARCFRDAALIHLRRRDAYLAELRAITPRHSHG